MSKKPVRNKGCANLMKLLGVDPNAPMPRNLHDARIIQEMEGGEALERRSGTRLENGCGKMVFTSQSACAQAMKNRLRRGSNVSKLRSYFCDTCAGYHMSSRFRD